MAPDPTTRTSEATAATAAGPLRTRYEAELAQRGYRLDAAQQQAVGRLEALRTRLLAAPRRPWWSRWRAARRGSAGPGVYLYGGVGRGKTWLMDLFYDSLGALPRERSHFHHFMRDVHTTLRALRRRRAPLEAVAAGLAERARVVCLDELYVADIADAMILGALFEALLRRDVQLVITSNLPPQGLYRDGLQRSRFLPAIELLERTLELVPVDGAIDYRLAQLRARPIYLDSVAGDSRERMQSLFEALAGEHGLGPAALEIQGRPVRALRRRGDVVWFDFPTLCEGARSQTDYVELAMEFRTVLLSDVPVFVDATQDDAARRFIALVDEFYDQGTKLVLSAAAAPAALYRAQRLKFEFQRASSRLVEMQTEEYLARPHRAAVATPGDLAPGS
ncbi:MAG TPA: cell division protein ZapE [Steroidobacteraceae bacterium]|nr:cell division protein ZapE [Steroidobacteraceae bacterium]